MPNLAQGLAMAKNWQPLLFSHLSSWDPDIYLHLVLMRKIEEITLVHYTIGVTKYNILTLFVAKCALASNLAIEPLEIL